MSSIFTAQTLLINKNVAVHQLAMAPVATSAIKARWAAITPISTPIPCVLWNLYNASSERVLRCTYDGTNTVLTVFAFGVLILLEALDRSLQGTDEPA